MTKIRTFKLLCFVFLLKCKCCYGADFQVQTSYGILQGDFYQNSDSKPYNFFLGVPYAQIPKGVNRFAKPVTITQWTYRDAKKDPNKCAQITQSSTSSSSQTIGNEDCLYLNIYTPSIPGSEKHTKLGNPQYPVMVWFHDGDFSSGSADDIGRPDHLVHKDVVVVTVNYRLGVFGFLSFDDSTLPGNMGLKDQVMALKWINSEISKFGGDVNKITVFGSGAGAASIHYLILCSSCRNLFQRAIMQSGSAYNPWALQRQPLQKSEHRCAETLDTAVRKQRKIFGYNIKVRNENNRRKITNGNMG